jgi:hypothetical protein
MAARPGILVGASREATRMAEDLQRIVSGI